MFYEVRVYDPSNQIKKIVRKKELSKRHWANFWREQTKNIVPNISKNISVNVKSKKAL